MKNKFLKWALLALAIAAAGGGYYYYASSAATAPAAMNTATVEKSSAKSIVSATGTIKPLNSVEISSKITALIKEIPVKENETVRAGDILVVLEDKELETRLDQARYKVNNAKTKYERTAYLHSIGAKSDQDLDDALLEYQTASSSLAGVQSNVDDTVILAPMDGVVVGEPKTVGTLVAQGVNNPTVIMTIADLSKKQISAKVDETDIGRVKVGQKAMFTVDAYTGKSFTATVTNISQTDVDSSWSSSSSSSAAVIYYNVTLDADDPENLLKPAMTARVDITVAEKENALMVPLAALKTSSEGQYVTLAKPDGTVEKVTVKTGIYSGDKVEVTEGLAEGDQLVVSYSKPAEKSSGKIGHPGGGPRM